jgi:hypothetical protein
VVVAAGSGSRTLVIDGRICALDSRTVPYKQRTVPTVQRSCLSANSGWSPGRRMTVTLGRAAWLLDEMFRLHRTPLVSHQAQVRSSRKASELPPASLPLPCKDVNTVKVR